VIIYISLLVLAAVLAGLLVGTLLIKKGFEARLKDLERHFVTKRDASGAPVETLADVPVSERDKLKGESLKGLSWPQRRAILERTDGGRRLG